MGNGKRILSAAILGAALGGCGTMASRDEMPPPPPTAAKAPPPATTSRPGGYYLDDGPGSNPPANLDRIPDAVPRAEPLHRAAARPYTVMGRSYTPMAAVAPYRARGLATWYGRRYHGKPTSSGEIYDMYAMTAAHPTLPLPSYARVTHLGSGKSVVVRINDRGPFHEERIIDLSYTAAHRLGILGGAMMVEVESIIPDAAGMTAEKAPAQTPPPAQVAGPAAPKPLAQAAGTAAFKAPAEPGFSVISPAAAESPLKLKATNQVMLPARAAGVAEVPVTTEGGRVFLQLGAFGSRENAEGYLSRLKTQADWLALQVFASGGLFRVQAGPYANQTEARQIVDRLGQALGIKALVLIR